MQTKLDVFIYRKGEKNNQNNNQSNNQTNKNQSKLLPHQIKIKKQSNYHQSSRQNSDNQTYNYYQKNQPPSNAMTCLNLILPGPFDCIFQRSIKKGLQDLLNNYTKANVLKYLQKNMSFHNVKNVQNLMKINDNQFWKDIMQKMIRLVLNKGQQICSCIKTLVSKVSLVTMLSREQVLLILISMFLGIMPKNSFSKVRSFGQFMYFNQSDNKSDLRLQKLKFIINYFKTAIKYSQQTLQQMVTYQKVKLSQSYNHNNNNNNDNINNNNNSQSYKFSSILNTQNHQHNIPMLSVKFADSNQLIQDYYGHAAMVDFANRQIGGGVLRNGSVQQQILFLIFPQAIVSMLISPPMNDDQAIIMYGLRKFSKYTGYSYNLKYSGKYNDDLIDVNNSIMIAIDAMNFNGKMSTDLQYTKDITKRQIYKAIAGFQGIQYAANTDMKICTGRWGCGAFKGDQVWKFFIQWIACSEAGREMVYITDQQELKRQFKQAVKLLVDKNTLDVLALMEGYAKQRKIRKLDGQECDFFRYLIKYA